MAKRETRRQLKMEPDLESENALEQLLASLRRIEAGLTGVRDLVLAIDRGIQEVTRGRD